MTCPFCHASATEVRVEGDAHQVVCLSCGACGPIARTVEEAVRRWGQPRDQLVDLYQALDPHPPAKPDYAAALRIAEEMVAASVVLRAEQPPGIYTTAETQCACHERDGSYVCDYCRSLGEKGHMQCE